ncbi:hypothetical protein NM688_g4346 [Phlebia brevispora]|uniref:Uncharacterized protein n=1 Tax=Phlebia brevispora TaxID=194682 RepID=A0ACC1T3B6_9APHY|nr:hypothetical protein NM688_g4346 [Phlebia brevispora]
MDRLNDHYESYSWHQAIARPGERTCLKAGAMMLIRHRLKATVLLLVPYDTSEDDIAVVFERNFLVAGVRGQPPTVKGRLYGNLDVANSSWQLEPHTSRLSARERTTSTTSTASTQSSFAIVSDAEISSSFAASVEGVPSDLEEPYLSSPALSSPVSLSDDHNSFPLQSAPRRQQRFVTSNPVSPHTVNPTLSISSSYSSLESLHTGSGRLLTIHLEKADSVIWPSLVVGPVLETLSPCNSMIYPWFPRTSNHTENRYNMDPTSLVLIALELADIREQREEAFEYFV